STTNIATAVSTIAVRPRPNRNTMPAMAVSTEHTSHTTRRNSSTLRWRVGFSATRAQEREARVVRTVLVVSGAPIDSTRVTAASAETRNQATDRKSVGKG